MVVRKSVPSEMSAASHSSKHEEVNTTSGIGKMHAAEVERCTIAAWSAPEELLRRHRYYRHRCRRHGGRRCFRTAAVTRANTSSEPHGRQLADPRDTSGREPREMEAGKQGGLSCLTSTGPMLSWCITTKKTVATDTLRVWPIC